MKHKIGTRALSLLLTLVMVFTMIPTSVLAAGVNDSLVTSLAEVYDGDEARAREELEALYEAGIIDAGGNMVSLDIREDGRRVALDETARRIANGETVGALTVNGHAATPEKLMQLQQVSSLLEVLRLIDKDVEITDEHVANLQALMEGIADGSIDLSDVISRGEVQLNRTRNARLLSTANSDGLPTPNTGTGEVEATDGKYTAPYISGNTYEANHQFALRDSANNLWYSDHESDAVVTLNVIPYSDQHVDENGNAVVERGGTVVVRATLNKPQPVPVSFDWAAEAGSIGVWGSTTRGSVTWVENDTELTKEFYFSVDQAATNWDGTQSAVLNVGNIKNATFADGSTVWSRLVYVEANDKEAIVEGYPGRQTKELDGSEFTAQNEAYTQIDATGYEPERRWFYALTDHLFPAYGTFRATATYNYNSPNYHAVYVYLLGPNATIDNPLNVYQSPYDFSRTPDFTQNDLNLGSKLANILEDGKVWVCIRFYEDNNATLTKFTVEQAAPALHNEVTGVSVPAGTYYSGQVIPVTVSLKEHAVAPAGTTLMVNGVACPLLEKPNTESKKFSFAYTVKGTDVVTLNVTGLSGLINAENQTVLFDNGFPEASFGTDQGVRIVSTDVKTATLDLEKAKCGIDDAGYCEQVVTVVIPFRADVDKTWVANETVALENQISLSVPGYENATAEFYLKSAYFSVDGGLTRYPVYIIGENADALVARFVPPVNSYGYLRKDTVELFLDPATDTQTDYLGGWSSSKTDVKGFAYFDATKNYAPAVSGSKLSFFVKETVPFDPLKTVSRPGYDAADIMGDGGDAVGFYKIGNEYVVVQGGDYDKQHDVELVVNEALYKVATRGVRVEESSALTLTTRYQFSNRDSFSFTDPKFFTWTSSDTSVAVVEKDENTGAGRIALTGKDGKVTITLTVVNGTNKNQYNLAFTFTVLKGKAPFLSIPVFSRERKTLTGTGVDILFSSNATVRNAALGKSTTFTAKLYQVSAVGTEPTGDPLWADSFVSTVENTCTHISVPGEQLTAVGVYAVVISTQYEGGEVDGAQTQAADLSASAWLIVKQAPVKITLNPSICSAEYNAYSTIGYTLASAGDHPTVEYTIQKSGEAASERKSATNGTITFKPAKPTGLKDSYTITVYARNSAEDPWSVDSVLLRAYNPDILNLIVKDVTDGAIGGSTGGTGSGSKNTTVTMDNHGKLEKYGITDGSYKLTVDDMNALRTDLNLQKLISANYGDGVWGLLSDKMQWSSSDSSKVSINYEQGGMYSDIRNYNYTSYGPATDFLLVGKDNADGVTVTATHAATGMKASVKVKADTLKDQLYVFQFTPQVETDVTYTNGKNVERTLKSNEKGELAVYEPDGIASSVMVMSEKDGQTYVGTIFNSELQSGERDISALQVYPCNNLRLRSISQATLSFKQPDGSDYNGQVTLRVGVYKNGVYCPDAKVFLAEKPEEKFGRQDNITATLSNGKLTLGFNPTEFKNNPTDAQEDGASPRDKITYVFEYHVPGYQTSYALVHAYTNLENEQDPTDSVVQLRTAFGSDNVPQLTRQTIQQYYDGKAVPYTRDVTDYTENIGISKRFGKVELITEYVLPNNFLSGGDQGYPTFSGEFGLYTISGDKLTGQTGSGEITADQITDLSALNDSNLFVFPFSSAVFGRSVYMMTDENMKADGISDEGENPTSSARIKAVLTVNGLTVMSVTMPFGVSNLSHQLDLANSESGVEEVASEVKENLGETKEIGSVFEEVNVNSMLKSGFAFLGDVHCGGKNQPFNLMIIPTENPGIFRIVVFIGYNQDRNKEDEDGLTIDYNPQNTYEDISSLIEEADDDNISFDFSFSGTIIIEAGYDFSAKKWKIDFCGGSVGVGFGMNFSWTQNAMCGPVPVTITLEIGGDVDVKVSFINKSAARSILVDATIGLSIEAFAGLGADYSVVSLKIGLNGKIGATADILYLDNFKDYKKDGEMLSIDGEIGIKFVAKMLFAKYTKTFCSTGFGWSKKWRDYDNIIEKWTSNDYAELLGVTASGRAYTMRLFANGTALVEIDDGGELENRDYLEIYERAWNSGAPTGRRLLKAAGPMSNALSDVQTNSYPFAYPVLTDDGSMFLYISDNDNPDAPQSVVSYAVKSENGYTNMGAVDTSEGNILADSSVAVSGTGNNVFGVWVKQMESPEKEMHDKITYDDLGMMMNATEIYAGAYTGKAWNVERLTNNKGADMSPTVASSGSQAIVAWRSLCASEMPEEGGSEDLTAMFNVEDNINYRIYNGTSWTEAKVAYNGSAGTVNAIDSAMLSDGTAILVYTVRAGEGVTGTETFYTVIDKVGNVVTTGRLTNDSYIDTNAQVAAVGNQFVLGWYSEHDAGEGMTSEYDANGNATPKAVVAHDIRLARINANGSFDDAFPESIGGDSASSITSDFRFSSPAGCNDLNDLSIVWSQKKDSEKATDAGKYELNAVRFYKDGSTIGFTAPTDIAETAKNNAVDHFDTYTDQEDGRIYVLIMNSDYSDVAGLSVYDSIDLTNLPVVATNSADENQEHLTILEQEPVVGIKLGSGTFPETAVEVTADTNLKELVPGLNLPVQFTVKNTGTSVVNSLTVQLGSDAASETVTGLSLLPNQSTIITVVYPVPEGTVADMDYTVSANDAATETGKLTLNRPDVGIYSMKLMREESGERDIQVTLCNASGIPLAGSGKTVKLAFYKDCNYTQQVGTTIDIPVTAYADIDAGIYSYTKTLKVTDFIGEAQEIPEDGIRVYARAWVESVNELYAANNTSFISFKGLLDKNNGEKLTTDVAMESGKYTVNGSEKNKYTVYADIRNNSMQQQEVKVPLVVLLDSAGNAIASKNLFSENKTLNKEQRISASVTFEEYELKGKIPASARISNGVKITFNNGGGTGGITEAYTDDSGHLKNIEDTTIFRRPTVSGAYFLEWTTEQGDKITSNYTFTEDTTVFAKYVTHIHNWIPYPYGDNFTPGGSSIKICCVNGQGTHTGSGALTKPITIAIYAPTLNTYGGEGSEKAMLYAPDGHQLDIVYKKDGQVLSGAPTDAGTYTASFTVGTKSPSVTYTIAKANQSAPAAPTLDTATANTIQLTAVDGCEYSKDGTNWQDSTTFTGLSNSTQYTFYQRLKETANYNASPSSEAATFSTSNHAHEWSGFTANGATITATCGNHDGCSLADSSYQATLTIAAPQSEITYDGSEHPATITDDNGIKGDVKVLYAAKGADGNFGEASETAPVDAGTYKASITLGTGNNTATAEVEYTIKNAALTNVSVTPSGALTYNGQAQTPQVTTAATAVKNQTVTFTYSLTEKGTYGEMPSFTNVADAGTVYFKASAPNHNDVTGSFTVTMNKATPNAPAAPTTENISASSVTLNAVDGCEYSMDGTNWQDSTLFTGLERLTEYDFYQRLAETDNTNASPASTAKIKTSDHDHNWGSFTVDGATISATCANTDTFHTGELTATMVISAPTLTIYGGTGSAEATVANDIAGIETPEIVYKKGDEVLGAAPTAAGTYTASITLNGVTASVEYTIQKAALTVTANAKTITYGDAPANDGVTYSGFVNSETEAVLGGTLDYDYSYTQYGDVGNAYTITPKGLTADNYTITFADGTLTVEQKEVGFSWGEHSFTYNGQTQKPAATATGLVNSDEIGVTVSGEQTNASATAYTATATGFTGEKAGNYKLPSAVTQTFTIGKAALTVTAKPKTITYGDAPANDGVEYEGFVNGETAAVLGGTLAYDYSYTQYGDVDDYSITPKGLTSGNYNIAFADGTLTVVQKEIGLDWTDLSFPFDGQTHKPTVTPTGVVNNDAIEIPVYGAQTNVGTYTASVGLAGVKAANYMLPGVYTHSFEITQIAISGAIVQLAPYAHGTAVSTPVFVNDSVDGANGTIVEGDATKHVDYYYQATAFLSSQTETPEAVAALAATEGVSTTITPTTFDVGKHYVLAVVTGDNYSNDPYYITQSVFEITQNIDTVRTAPTAPTVDGTTVTVAEADRAKALEYSLDGQTWLPVTLDEDGSFKAEWPNAVSGAALKLRETADANYSKPSAAAQGSQTVTTTTFTVTYDANGGLNAPDPVTVTTDKTVRVSAQSGMTRTGHTFDGWITAANGSGTPYAAGDTVNTGMKLYAQWTENTYTVQFSANGGTGTMEKLENVSYTEEKTLPANSFARTDYNFIGWSTSSSGSVMYPNGQKIKGLATGGTVTLYAVWAKDLYTLRGTIYENDGTTPVAGAEIKLKLGSTVVETKVSAADGTYNFTAAPPALYNIVATKDDVTKTELADLTENKTIDLTMPDGQTSSILDVQGSNTPPAVVGGLEDVAADEEIDGRSIVVTMTVKAQSESENADAEEIGEVASGDTGVLLLEITVEKEIKRNGNVESTEAITDTGNTVVEIIVPYDFNGKSSVKVYRCHGDDPAEELELSDTGADGTYKLDRTNGRIYIYASKFSTYAIGYKTYNYAPSTYKLTVLDSEHGTVIADKTFPEEGAKVTLTVTPDEGYELDTITATNAKGNEVKLTKNEDGTYTFKQPDSKVTVTATFKEVKKSAQTFFVDVAEDSYYYDAVKWAVENGITNGVDETHFAPNASCTRAQMVTFLWRAAGEPEPTITATAFTDVDESAYYYKAVLWAYENGITLGTSDTTFSPNATVTRAQSVTFLFRALSGAAGAENPFEDVKDGTYYADAVKWAYENGITLGTSDTMFSPENDCLRAQIVTFLYRAYNEA